MKAAAAHAADLPGHSPPAGARQPWAVALDSALGHLVEIPAALLVVAEIIILFSGIVARYVLHTPLVWSDELASILFLWLAMLGSVIAFRRGEHMRMAALVNRASPATRAMLDMVAVAAALAFLLMLQGPGFEYASEERYVTTAALEIPNVARRRAAGEHGADDADRAAAAGRAWPVAHHGPRAAAGGRRGRPDACAAARAGRTGQCQPADLLRRHRRRVRIRRRAHRLRLRPGDVRLPVADHRPAHDGGGGAHGRRHVAPDPAGRAAVRVPGRAHRNDRHGAAHGRVPGQPARTRAAACPMC